MKGLWNREPVLFIGVLQAALALLLAFGVHLMPGQIGAIMAFAAAVLAFVTRSQVTPTTSADAPLGSINPNSLKAPLVVLALAGALLGGGVTATGCGGSLRHVATVSDATALSATEAADDLEMGAFTAGRVLAPAHKAFSVELSKVYQAEIDIARLIKAVPAGGTVDLSQGLALLDTLRTAVTSALAALPASVSGPIANELNKAVAFAGRPLGK